MKRPLRGTDWLLLGAQDYAANNEQVHRPDAGMPGEADYLAGWRAAALDDLNDRARCALEVDR